jgi:predicted transcriptional regulator
MTTEDHDSLHLTVGQIRILNHILIEKEGSHAYGLAKSLKISEDSVRSAIRALEAKGLIKEGSRKATNLGPMRRLYIVVSEGQARTILRTARQKKMSQLVFLTHQIAEMTLMLKEVESDL